MFHSPIRMLPARPALTGLALALAIAACGGSAATTPLPPEAQVAPVADPVGQDAPGAPPAGSGAAILADAGGLCAEIPIAPSELALGAPIAAAIAKESSLGFGTSCRITTAGEATTLDITRSEETTLSEFKEAMDTVGLTDETVPNLGEFAYRAPETALGGPGARLAVFSGVRDFGVTVYAAEGSDQAVLFDASETIARAVIEAAP
jgi:hypothetical protein